MFIAMIRRNVVSAALLLLLSACGPLNLEPSGGKQRLAPELAPYVVHYMEITGLSVTYPAVFTDGRLFQSKDVTPVAECQIDGKFRRVLFLQPYFDDLPADSDRQLLVDHELGHCSGNLGHNTHRNEDGCPRSLMYPYLEPVTNCQDVAGYYYPEDGSEGFRLPGWSGP